MGYLEMIALGAIQGATEFLPVSSSGHLAASQMLLAAGENGGDRWAQPLALEVLLHAATLLAVIAVYRREVLGAVCGAGRALAGAARGDLGALLERDDDANLAVAIAVGSVPTAAIGLLMRDPAAAVSQSPLGLGLAFLGCALLLAASRWWRGGSTRLSWRAALIVGAVQGIAVIPGISRSGATIATALALGLGREEAARFSFLLSAPAIVGAAVLELDAASLASSGLAGPCSVGAIAAFAVGAACLVALLRLVRAGRLWLFAPYVAAAGLFSIAFL